MNDGTPTRHACADLYSEMCDQARAVLDESTAPARVTTLAKTHSYLQDLEEWGKALSGRTEMPFLVDAFRQLQFALLISSQGFYRHAIAALRFYLEQSLGVAYLSVNEWHFRQWKCGSRDISWSSILDDNTGMFSVSFADAFFPDLRGEVGAIRSIARTVYRESSESVHGNPSTLTLGPGLLEFSVDAFDTFHTRAETIHYVVTFGLTLRYLCDLANGTIEKLESPILDRIGTITPVRGHFERHGDADG